EGSSAEDRLARLIRAGDADAEAVEVDVLALVLAGAAAFETDAQEDPETGELAGVVVAVVVDIAFEEPAPDAALAAGVGLLLPALQDAGKTLQNDFPGLWIGDVHAALVGPILRLDTGNRTHCLEEPMFQRRRAPRRPEINGDTGSLEGK